MKLIKGIISLIVGGLLGFTINYYIFSDIIAIYYPENSMAFYAVLITTMFCCVMMVAFLLFQKIDARLLLIIKVAYFCALAIILFGRETMIQEVVLNPLDSINDLNDPEMVIQSSLNLVVFIPMGFVFRNQVFSSMLIKSIVLSCGIELVQWVLSRGIFDTFDVILYVLGIIVGYFIFTHMQIEIVGDEINIMTRIKKLFKEIINERAE